MVASLPLSQEPSQAPAYRSPLIFRVFDIVYPDRPIRITTSTYPDGKLEQYLVEPSQ